MSFARIKEKYQVTIPVSIRRKLGLKVGDVLEATVKDDHILLQPQAVIGKSQALKRFLTILEEVHRQNKDVSEEEVMEDVMNTIQAVRRHKHAQRRR